MTARTPFSRMLASVIGGPGLLRLPARASVVAGAGIVTKNSLLSKVAKSHRHLILQSGARDSQNGDLL